MTKDLLSINDLKDDLASVISDSIRLKTESGPKKSSKKSSMSGKNVVLLFEKPSLRTKASFAVAVQQLGGNAVYMSPDEVQIGKRESVSDVGKVLSRYFDVIVYRAFSHTTMVELAEAASAPVINALDDLEHPCQIVGDLMTIKEKKGDLKGLKLAYIGDGNNVCNSLLLGCAIVGMNISVASPTNHKPSEEVSNKAKELTSKSGSNVDILTNPFKAAENADIIYTDVWVSMGQESEREEKEKVFLPYQISEKTMSNAKPDAIFMHCLPAHRGLEVVPEVIDGPKSVIFDQAENRLHAQKGMLLASLK
ncbi:MAG: ornithine carbamoyltransferase [Thermoplasmata archaeon]|nr:ornithine carbamoyltransferase [Thermoplasmata archaeon]